ncbi:hypothetical protein Lalb_Chr10g0090951 [Lupinus albus]|uniref:Uncharacterized protein n=1 Tax=Lupinus albus TaxID=3870 RepID=A0A6A4PTP4_LUPAL|nr:hypothetical protein Lalb_Chr10g0090951 [Lupinus albus]
MKGIEFQLTNVFNLELTFHFITLHFLHPLPPFYFILFSLFIYIYIPINYPPNLL